MAKNLIYSIYALASNKEWELNIAKLSEYASIFDGKCQFIVRHDKNTIAPLEIEEKLKEFRCKNSCITVMSNNPKMGESKGFIRTLALSLEDKSGHTFYAHTKGVTHPNSPTITEWRNTMYDKCLSVDIESILTNFVCAGCYRVTRMAKPLLLAKWHYSGNFWWVNNLSLNLIQDWDTMGQHYYGVEEYLGSKFPLERSYCIFEDNLSRNLYLPKPNIQKHASRTAQKHIQSPRLRPTCKICGRKESGLRWCTFCGGKMELSL